MSIYRRTHQSSNVLNASWPPNSDWNSWALSTGSLAPTSNGPPTKTVLSSATCQNKPMHITLSGATTLPISTSTRSPLLTNRDAPLMLHYHQTSTKMTRYSSDAAKHTNPSLDASRGFPQTPVQTCPLQYHFLYPVAAVQTNSTLRLSSTCSNTSAPPSHKVSPTTHPHRPPHQPNFTIPLPMTVKRTLKLLLPRLTSLSRVFVTQTGASRLEMPSTTALILKSSSNAQ